MSTQHLADEMRRPLLEALQHTVEDLRASMNTIPPARKDLLESLASFITDRIRHKQPAKLIFICTHNSRRSHISQVWAQAAAWLYGLDGVEAHSGGTEATAFHSNAIDALTACGFRIRRDAAGQNPPNSVQFSSDAPAMTCWSKRFDDESNPRKDFAAIMTCSDADEACPIVPGAAARFPVRYEDPKESDGSGREAEVYGARCREIGTEMLYVMQRVRRECAAGRSLL